MSGSKFFYKKPIASREEREFVNKVLEKFKSEPVGEELKKKVYDALAMEKYKGNLSAPFEVVLKSDPYGRWGDTIEVTLETKL